MHCIGNHFGKLAKQQVHYSNHWSWLVLPNSFGRTCSQTVHKPKPLVKEGFLLYFMQNEALIQLIFCFKKFILFNLKSSRWNGPAQLACIFIRKGGYMHTVANCLQVHDISHCSVLRESSTFFMWADNSNSTRWDKYWSWQSCWYWFVSMTFYDTSTENK